MAEKLYPLTNAQKRVYFSQIKTGAKNANYLWGIFRIKHSLFHMKDIKNAINAVINNNSTLRINLTEKSGEVYQYFKENNKHDIAVIDLSNVEDTKAAIEDIITYKEKEDEELVKFRIIIFKDESVGILLKIHHIIADGWSMSLIQQQICECLMKKQNREISIKKYNYVDYIEEERKYLESERFRKDKLYWEQKFEDLPKEFTYRASNLTKGRRNSYSLDEELIRNIQIYLRDNKCTMHEFFVVIVSIYLYKITNKSDIVLGVPIYNRRTKVQKQLIGMCTSTIALRIRFADDLNINTLVQNVKDEFRNGLRHQQYPYNLLIRELGLNAIEKDTVFNISVNYYNFNMIQQFGDYEATVHELFSGEQFYSMQVLMNEWESKLIIDYKVSEYSNGEIESMYRALMNIIDGVIGGKKELKDISLISKEEFLKKNCDINNTNVELPEKSVLRLFEEQAKKTPYNVAIYCDERKVLYKELSERSNQFAALLKSKGVRYGDIVAIMERHSVELVIGILGILKAGAAYMPIDPNCPRERIQYMIQDTKCQFCVTNMVEKADLFQNVLKTTIIEINQMELRQYDFKELATSCDLAALAYIIYTSGTTGRPKGVQIQHGGLVNYVTWAQKQYLGDNEVMALYSSIAFDLTVTSIFTPIISGNAIDIYRNDENEFSINKILRKNRVTVIKLTPAHLSFFRERDLINSRIHTIIVGGEDLKVHLARDIYNRTEGKVSIYNEYGPTETVVGCMIRKYNPSYDLEGSVPVGVPISNNKIYVLDEKGNLVPDEVEGEIYISGEWISPGYINLEDETPKRFIENPFVSGLKMYKTGDIAKYRDGEIIYIRRKDRQIKFHGYRIELDEIENCLISHNVVQDAVVRILKRNITEQLVAYVVGKVQVKTEELRQYMQEYLPYYMIPTVYIWLDKIPLNVNGKVKEESLPEPKQVSNELWVPSSEKEKLLSEVLCRLLANKAINFSNDFYALGGDSIKAIQLSAELKKFDYDLSVSDILQVGSIKQLAEKMKPFRNNEDAFIVSENKTVRKSEIIKWFIEEYRDNLDAYNQYLAIRLPDKYEKNDIRNALLKLIRFHESLQINFDDVDEMLYYNERMVDADVAVNEIEYGNEIFQCTQKVIEELIEKENIKFNIRTSLLIRLILIHDGKKGDVLLFIAHHLVVDAISWRIIVDDFLKIINSKQGTITESLVLHKTVSFQQWNDALYEYAKQHITQKDYNDWNQAIDMIREKQYMLIEIDANSNISHNEFKIIDAEKVKKICREYFHTQFSELVTIAFAYVVHKVFEIENVALILEGHGRDLMEHCMDVSRTVGWFTILYPAFFTFRKDNIVLQYPLLKEQLRDAQKKSIYSSYIGIGDDIRIDFGKQSICFNYLGDMSKQYQLAERIACVEGFGLYSGGTRLPHMISVNVALMDGELIVDMVYSNVPYLATYVQEIQEQYIKVFCEIANYHNIIKSNMLAPSDFKNVDITFEDINELFE